MPRPTVSPAAIDATISGSGMQGQTVTLTDVPLPAGLTARVLLDNPASIQVRVHVTVFRTVTTEVPDNTGVDNLPPGVQPGTTTSTTLVAVGQSDGTRPIGIEIGETVKIDIASGDIDAGFNTASGALLITGSTWDPISIPITFQHGGDVAVEFDSTELKARQGATASTGVSIRWLGGPALDVNLYMTQDDEAEDISMDPVALRVLPGETKKATLNFHIERDAASKERILRIIKTGGRVESRNIHLAVTPAPVVPPSPTGPTLEQATAQINAFYDRHRGLRGPFGFPLGNVQRDGNTFFRRFAGGTIKLLNTGPQGMEITWVRVRFVGFTCLSESNKLSASEEPYFFIGVAAANGSNTVRFGPYENVDAGESRYEATDIASRAQQLVPPIVIGVIAMENDEGTPAEAEAKVRRVVESITSKFEQAVAAFTGAAVGSHVIPEWARDILVGWIPEGIAAILGMGDDEVGRTAMLVYDNKQDLLEWRSEPVRGMFGPNEYTRSVKVGEDDGPEGQYELFFKIDIFKTTETIVGP